MKINYNELQHLNDSALLLPGRVASSMYWSDKAFSALADSNFKITPYAKIQFPNKQAYVQWHFERTQHVIAEAMQYQLSFIIRTLSKIIKKTP